jgi:hypothetical protein
MRAKTLQVTATSVNAALYATVGALWTLFPVIVFGVRFWPQVFVPATFAILFGPWVGGVGAAIGIFAADVIYGHHDALLSFLVGVPSNFVAFFVIGYLSNQVYSGIKRILLFAASLAPEVAFTIYALTLLESAGVAGLPLYIVLLAGLVGAVITTALFAMRRAWLEFEIAASIGLALGSGIIGVGLVLFSYFFTLPQALGLGSNPLPIAFGFGAAAWTFLSEIPFLILLTPPIVMACRAAIPSLKQRIR